LVALPGRSAAHRVLHAIGLDRAATQVTSAEHECLVGHARNKRRLLEIGVYEGATTRLLIAAAAPDAELFAVDPFLKGRIGICWARGIAGKEISEGLKTNRGVRIHVVEQFSFDAARAIHGHFDFIFVDGDHSPEGIRRDWNDWAGRVGAGGIVALHDTRVPAHNPNVATLGSYQFFESVIRFDPRYELVQQVDSLSILVRKAE